MVSEALRNLHQTISEVFAKFPESSAVCMTLWLRSLGKVFFICVVQGGNFLHENILAIRRQR